MTPIRRRRGFALPMAILALALITASVASSYASARAETVSNNASRAQDRAYALAEGGLQQFVARRGEAGFCTNCVGNPLVADSEWTRVSLVGGYADVVAMRIRPRLADTIPAVFFIRSRGVDTTIKMSGTGSTVYAERSVGQYATFGTASLKVLAAWTSLAGITKSSSNTIIGGADECGVKPSVAGVVVPRSEFRKTGSTPEPTGSPGVDSSMTIDSLKKRVGIDWNAIVNNDAIPASVTIPGQSWSTGWRVTRIKQANYTIQSDGNGILIADGNLTFSGARDFDGIILVGGRLIASGNQPSSGATISGLNYLLPGAGNPVPGSANDDTLRTNTKSFLYNSCNVATALALLDTYYAWSNTWLDNVAVW